MVRSGLTFSIRLYSVTVRFDKRLHIPVIFLKNDPNNPRQTFVHARNLFFFKAFVEHFYQSLYASWEPCGHVAGAKASRLPLCFYMVAGSRRRMTKELFRFGHFGIPLL